MNCHCANKAVLPLGPWVPRPREGVRKKIEKERDWLNLKVSARACKFTHKVARRSLPHYHHAHSSTKRPVLLQQNRSAATAAAKETMATEALSWKQWGLTSFVEVSRGRSYYLVSYIRAPMNIHTSASTLTHTPTRRSFAFCGEAGAAALSDGLRHTPALLDFSLWLHPRVLSLGLQATGAFGCTCVSLVRVSKRHTVDESGDFNS
jgi:hypothetical protein